METWTVHWIFLGMFFHCFDWWKIARVRTARVSQIAAIRVIVIVVCLVFLFLGIGDWRNPRRSSGLCDQVPAGAVIEWRRSVSHLPASGADIPALGVYHDR